MNAQRICYIVENINDGELSFNSKREILQTIMCHVDNSKIIEKGDGTEIKFEHMNDQLIERIYKIIHSKLS